MDLREAERLFGLSVDTSTGEFAAVRKRLARRYHPDRYSSGPDRDAAQQSMTEINAAFEQLRRERQRRRTLTLSDARPVAAPTPTEHFQPPSNTAIRKAVAIWLGILVFLLVGALLVGVLSLNAALALTASAVIGASTTAFVWWFPKIVE